MSDPARARTTVAAAIVAAEVMVVVVLGVVEAVNIDRDRVTAGVTTTVFFGLYAAGLAWSARGLAQLRGWSRGPVVLAQLIQLGVAWSFAGSSTAWVAVALALPAALVLAVVFSPATTTALYADRDGDGEGTVGG
ncbi:MAG: hypothetical protein H0U28_03975 [Nocardioidaceae bacterium]|nr:hypothetical protein [Nocardioidaceae bacterium]